MGCNKHRKKITLLHNETDISEALTGNSRKIIWNLVLKSINDSNCDDYENNEYMGPDNCTFAKAVINGAAVIRVYLIGAESKRKLMHEFSMGLIDDYKNLTFYNKNCSPNPLLSKPSKKNIEQIFKI
jgi:hypothetical protein